MVAYLGHKIKYPRIDFSRLSYSLINQETERIGGVDVKTSKRAEGSLLGHVGLELRSRFAFHAHGR